MLSEQKLSVKLLVIGAVLLIATVKGSSAIMCYHCNSAYDPRCADPFNSFSIGMINCSAQPPTDHMTAMNLTSTLCRKTTQKVYGVTRVVRGCGYITDERDDKQCMKRSGTHDVHALYCACTSDLCNKSNQLFHQQKIIYAILIMPLIYFINQQFNGQL